MQAKQELITSLVENLENLTGRKIDHHKGALDFFEFQLRGLNISIQSDFEAHLEMLISLGGRDFSNGGDHITTFSHWTNWAADTTDNISKLKDVTSLKVTEYSKKGKYIGGFIQIGSNKKNRFYSLQNNLFPLFKSVKTFDLPLDD